MRSGINLCHQYKPGTKGRRALRKLDEKRVATAILVSWGEEFRRWREAKGLYQKNAADYLEVSLDTIKSWECRRNVPNKYAMRAIRNAMRRYKP